MQVIAATAPLFLEEGSKPAVLAKSVSDSNRSKCPECIVGEDDYSFEASGEGINLDPHDRGLELLAEGTYSLYYELCYQASANLCALLCTPLMSAVDCLFA